MLSYGPYHYAVLHLVLSIYFDTTDTAHISMDYSLCEGWTHSTIFTLGQGIL